MVPILGYWDVRGRTDPIRLFLHHVGVKYEDKLYLIGSTGMGEWFQDKPKLEKTMGFPSLPYYIDGDLQIAQTKAILAYLGRKHGLDGQTEEERIRIDVAREGFNDMYEGMINIGYPGGFGLEFGNKQEVHDKMFAAYEASIPTVLASVTKFLNGKWVAGDRLTYVDFFVYDVLDWHRTLFDPKYVAAEKGVCEYMKRFEGLKGVKEYMATPAFQASRLPVFSPWALYGQDKDYKPKPASH